MTTWYDIYPILHELLSTNWELFLTDLAEAMEYPVNKSWHFGSGEDMINAFVIASYSKECICEWPECATPAAIELFDSIPSTCLRAKIFMLQTALSSANTYNVKPTLFPFKKLKLIAQAVRIFPEAIKNEFSLNF